MVDELCAKDGGIKIYETVTLSASMFNAYGQPKIDFQNKTSNNHHSNSGLYFSINQINIIGDPNSHDISRMAVWKTLIRLHRSSDGKVLGETILYSRSGGDPIGPWHPSSYGCPLRAGEWDLASKVVKKMNGGTQ